MNYDDEKIVSNIKALALDMIDNAKSGHPGIVLSAAKILYTLFSKHIIINPCDSNWIGRDRFVLSAGHASALLYSTLFMAGYNISLDDLKNFRKINSITPGHPELGITPGVDISTGPLGEGVANAVGMAIASKYLNTIYDGLLNNTIYCLVGDGDLMEGVSLEALSIAGNYSLDNLIILYDSNNMSLDSDTSNTLCEDTLLKFKAMNFDVIKVCDGNNLKDIDKAIRKAKNNKKPTLIEFKTILGKDSFLENTNKVHGGVLSNDDLINIKHKLNICTDSFYISNNNINNFRNMIKNRCTKIYNNWINKYNKLTIEDKNNINILQSLNKINYKFNFSDVDINIPFRDINNKVLNSINSKFIMNSSADLFSACKTKIDKFSDFDKNNYNGQNIYMGVREHGMSAIMNGISSYGLMSICSTFLSFSDYLKAGIRMSALMNLNVLYIFTHDSILIGEDGPTHQPVEQLTMLRAIPNLYVYRPSSTEELYSCYEMIFDKQSPSALIITKNKINIQINGDKNKAKYGAYIIKDEEYEHNLTIMSSGEELQSIILVAKNIEEELKIGIRVVSVPCLEIFEEQNYIYKEKILGNKKIITFEYSNDYKLARYATDDNHILNINEFGMSANKNDILLNFGYDNNNLKSLITNIISNY